MDNDAMVAIVVNAIWLSHMKRLSRGRNLPGLGWMDDYIRPIHGRMDAWCMGNSSKWSFFYLVLVLVPADFGSIPTKHV